MRASQSLWTAQRGWTGKSEGKADLFPGNRVAVLVSCIGRKLLLGQRICEEVEAVKDVFGDGTVLTGFYSYGEVSPPAATDCAELHNQTMTITVFGESVGA